MAGLWEEKTHPGCFPSHHAPRGAMGWGWDPSRPRGGCGHWLGPALPGPCQHVGCKTWDLRWLPRRKRAQPQLHTPRNPPSHGLLAKQRQFLPGTAKPRPWQPVGSHGVSSCPTSTFPNHLHQTLCIKSLTVTQFPKTLRAMPTPRARFHGESRGVGRTRLLFAGQGGRGEGWGRAAHCPLFAFTCVLCIWLLE